jgi:hypothetical protein
LIDIIRYKPNELQIGLFTRDMKNINADKAALEHEKMRN